MIVQLAPTARVEDAAHTFGAATIEKLASPVSPIVPIVSGFWPLLVSVNVRVAS